MRRKLKNSAMFSLLLAAALPMMFLQGCADMAMAQAGDCIDSLDCPTGWKCNQYKRCEQIPVLTSLVDLELYPEKGSGSVATQVAGLDLSRSDTDTDVELNEGATFSGQVTSPLGVTGSLVARRQAEFDSRRLTWNIPVGEDGYFETLLATATIAQMGTPDLTYEFLFLPANRTDFPQLKYLTGQVQSFGLSMELRYPEYPDQADLDNQPELLLVKVRILESESYPHPLTGIEVEGTTDSGLRTNLSTPDEQGYAWLRLPILRDARQPDEAILPTSLTLSIHPSESTIRLPTVTVADIELSQPDLGTFYLGDLPDNHSVTGVVVNGSGQPVGDCQLRFTSGAIGNGTFEQVVQADPEGFFSTTLPGGSYKVTAVPGFNDDVGITADLVEVTADMGSLSIALDPRPEVTGTVIDPSGQPVADVFIIAQRTADWTGLNDGLLREFETTSDQNGEFLLLPDPGAYELTFIPPPSSGLPRLLHHNRVITADVEMPRNETSLPQAAVLEGYVFSHAGVPMCGVTVNVYRSTDTDAILIGQTVSGNSARDGCNGSYTVVIPAQN